MVFSFPKQSLFFSLVPESFILKTLHEKGESPNKKGKGRKNKRMLTHPSSLIGKLQTGKEVIRVAFDLTLFQSLIGKLQTLFGLRSTSAIVNSFNPS